MDGVGPDLPPPERRAVVCGVGFGAPATYEDAARAAHRGRAAGLSPLAIPLVMPSRVAAHLSLRFDLRGPCVTVSAACASGAAAIGEGVELLRRGAADLVLAGGVDSLVTYGAMCGFMRLDVMSRNVDRARAGLAPVRRRPRRLRDGRGCGLRVLHARRAMRAADGARAGCRSRVDRATHTTWSPRARTARVPFGACGWRSRMPASTPATSPTSTHTGRARASTTWPRQPRSARCSAAGARRSPR